MGNRGKIEQNAFCLTTIEKTGYQVEKQNNSI